MSIDFERRPETYWPDGESRPPAPSPEQRAEMLELGRQHPAFMGGAFLPEAQDGEVEIVRVDLRSTTADVLSVRARPVADGIAYRVVDEYPEDATWHPPIEHSEQPLTVAEMMRMLRETYMEEEDWVRGISQGFRERTNMDNLVSMLDEALEFVTVSSRFYPELAELDGQEAEAWTQAIRQRARSVEDAGKASIFRAEVLEDSEAIAKKLLAAQAAISESGPDEQPAAKLAFARALRATGAYSRAVDELEALLNVTTAPAAVLTSAGVELAVLWACEGGRPDLGHSALAEQVESGEGAFANAYRALREALAAWDRGTAVPGSSGPPPGWADFARQDPQTAVSLALGLIEAFDFAGVPEVSLAWSGALTRVDWGETVPDLPQRLRLSLWFMRAAHGIGARKPALKTTSAYLPVAGSLPQSHPVAVEFLSQAASIFHAMEGVPFSSGMAYTPVLADSAMRRIDDVDPFAVRVLNQARETWTRCGSPSGADIAPNLRGIVIRNKAMGLYVPDWTTDLFSCVMRHTTARDMLGALTDGREGWSHRNVGLTIARNEDGSANLTFPAIHPEATDYHVRIDRQQVAQLQDFAQLAGVGTPLYATVGRNDPCPCGSGKKYKRCCGAA